MSQILFPQTRYPRSIVASALAEKLPLVSYSDAGLVSNLVPIHTGTETGAKMDSYIKENDLNEIVNMPTLTESFAATLHFVLRDEESRQRAVHLIEQANPPLRKMDCTIQKGGIRKNNQDCSQGNGTAQDNLKALKYIVMRVG